MNTINDLKRIVHRRLYPLDGEWVQNPKRMDIGIMLGISEEFPTSHRDVTDTILDPAHPFWAKYIRRVHSHSEAEEEVRVALNMLREEGTFEVRDDGNDGPGAYVHVRDLPTESSNVFPDDAEISFEPISEEGNLMMKVQTPDGMFRATLLRM